MIQILYILVLYLIGFAWIRFAEVSTLLSVSVVLTVVKIFTIQIEAVVVIDRYIVASCLNL